MDNSLGPFLTMMACLLLPFGWLAAVIWGIRTRFRDAKLIRQHIASGAYANWNKPPLARRFRLLGLLQLGSLLGLVLALGSQLLVPTSFFIVWASRVAAVVFGISVALIL